MTFETTATINDQQSPIATVDPLWVKGFELSLTDHCNLKCEGCNHASPHMARHFSPVDEIETDLKALKGIVASEQIRLAGGEPLMHPNLLEILQIARASGVAKYVTLITNGVLLTKVPEALWTMIDRLWISMYPNIKYHWEPEQIRAKCREHKVELFLDRKTSFNLTMINREISPKWAARVFNHCLMAHSWGCNVVLRGRWFMCPIAAFSQERLALKGIAFDNKEHDSIALHGNPNLRQDLERYLSNKKKPLKACSYCLGTVGREIEPRQLAKKGRRAELDADHGNLISLISVRNTIKSLTMGVVRKSRTIEDLIAKTRFRKP